MTTAKPVPSPREARRASTPLGSRTVEHGRPEKRPRRYSPAMVGNPLTTNQRARAFLKKLAL
jgi:hypothetical protein